MYNWIEIRRAILHVVGSAEDPDEVDYYTHTRGFPIAYTPDDDPEVVDEMKIAAIELNDGKDDVSEDESTADESDDEQWVDEDKDDDQEGGGKKKKARKTFSAVDKVRPLTTYSEYMLKETATCHCRWYTPVGDQA